MLYLLNSMPLKKQDWQQLESMLGTGDSVLFYEHAVALVKQEDNALSLLEWLNQGIKLFVLDEQSGMGLSVANSLIDKITVVNWEGFVDLTVNVEKVCAL